MWTLALRRFRDHLQTHPDATPHPTTSEDTDGRTR
jgi:hypothetical protein